MIVVVGAGLHAALLIWPGPPWQAIEAATWRFRVTRFSLSASTVLNGLLWSTDLANPNVWGQLVGLAIVLIASASGLARAVRSAASGGGVGWHGAVDLLAFGWVIHPREPLSRLAASRPRCKRSNVCHRPTRHQPHSRLASTEPGRRRSTGPVRRDAGSQWV